MSITLDDDSDEDAGNDDLAVCEVHARVAALGLEAAQEKAIATVINEDMGGISVHKAALLKELHEGVKLSADRSMRVQQRMGDGLAPGASLDLHVDAWKIGLYDDISIWCEVPTLTKLNKGQRQKYRKEVFFAKIIRVRKKSGGGKKGKGGRWVDYDRPMYLVGDRSDLKDVWLSCYWYQSKNNSKYVYTYTHTDHTLVHVNTIITPVTMTYQPAQGVYILDSQHYKIAQESLKGNQSLLIRPSKSRKRSRAT